MITRARFLLIPTLTVLLGSPAFAGGKIEVTSASELKAAVIAEFPSAVAAYRDYLKLMQRQFEDLKALEGRAVILTIGADRAELDGTILKVVSRLPRELRQSGRDWLNGGLVTFEKSDGEIIEIQETHKIYDEPQLNPKFRVGAIHVYPSSHLKSLYDTVRIDLPQWVLSGHDWAVDLDRERQTADQAFAVLRSYVGTFAATEESSSGQAHCPEEFATRLVLATHPEGGGYYGYMGLQFEIGTLAADGSFQTWLAERWHDVEGLKKVLKRHATTFETGEAMPTERHETAPFANVPYWVGLKLDHGEGVLWIAKSHAATSPRLLSCKLKQVR